MSRSLGGLNRVRQVRLRPDDNKRAVVLVERGPIHVLVGHDLIRKSFPVFLSSLFQQLYCREFAADLRTREVASGTEPPVSQSREIE